MSAVGCADDEITIISTNSIRRVRNREINNIGKQAVIAELQNIASFLEGTFKVAMQIGILKNKV